MDTLSLREFENIRISVPWGYVVGRWYGNRTVRPILALHGWLDNIGTWETLIPLMPEHIGVLCIDLPGHGQSSKYPKGMTYHVVDYVHIIMHIMQEYKWQKISLMAHSISSVVCFLYASLFPSTVDLLIAIDIIIPFVYLSNKSQVDFLAISAKNTLIEDGRLDNLALQEPPSYTYEELERLLYEGSKRSVDLENCKYILNRSIAKSVKHPDKYYFTRDRKVKFSRDFFPTPGLIEEMAKRIHNVPYFVVKGTRSKYINEDSNSVIKILRNQNPHFEFQTIEGTHHVHLNNAKEVAAVINPFIIRHRPMELHSSSVDEEIFENQRRNAVIKESVIQKIETSEKKKIKSQL